jgi:hypothetical protein
VIDDLLVSDVYENVREYEYELSTHDNSSVLYVDVHHVMNTVYQIKNLSADILVINNSYIIEPTKSVEQSITNYAVISNRSSKRQTYWLELVIMTIDFDKSKYHRQPSLVPEEKKPKRK